MEKLCSICNKREPHGYVQGSGEYLEEHCLPCHRRPRNRDNYIEGNGSGHKSRRPSVGYKEDK